VVFVISDLLSERFLRSLLSRRNMNIYQKNRQIMLVIILCTGNIIFVLQNNISRYC